MLLCRRGVRPDENQTRGKLEGIKASGAEDELCQTKLKPLVPADHFFNCLHNRELCSIRYSYVLLEST